MAISVVSAAGAAWDRMATVCFRPFDIGKWFVLGFCAWLAHLGEGGAHVNVPMPGDQSGDLSDAFEAASDWVQDHAALVISLAVLVLLAMIVIGFVLTWLQSRGKFMFLDGVVRNRGAVVEPWHAFRELGNSLFWFRVVLGLIGLVAFVVIAAVGILIALADILAERFGGAAIAGIAIGGVLLLAYAIAFGIIGALLEDFVVPVMYRRGVRTVDAWGVFRREVLPGNGSALVRFYLLKVLLGIAIGVVALLATCCTCCLAALPYLGTVILLPLFVFGRSYSLGFLEQCGEGWRFLPDEAPLPPANAT
jgi:hypothetical protein